MKWPLCARYHARRRGHLVNKQVLTSQAFALQRRWFRGREMHGDDAKLAKAGIGGRKESERIPGKEATSKQLPEEEE